MTKKILFPVYISENVINDPKIDLWIDKTLHFAKEENKESQKSNIGGYQTSDVLDNEIANLLAPYVYKGAKEITNVTKNIYFGNLWINENMKGDYNALHCHPGSQYSAVYYRDVPKDSGNLVFYRSDMSAINMAEIKDEVRYIVHPKKGLLIIFPAYLTHLVNPNQSDKSRVSISFNFSFK
tara:strand:- start:1399 stop:1941 length:543 start_codon:yes stop_codon:yes gene_type:complete